MNADNRRLLLDWLEAEEHHARPLLELLTELADKRQELASLARFLAIKQSEESARRAVLERERWFRSFSWRMVVALFAFGVAGMLAFVLWGGEQAFLSSIFFFAGGASFYLLVQAMATVRSRRDRRTLAEIQERSRRERAALRKELGR